MGLCVSILRILWGFETCECVELWVCGVCVCEKRFSATWRIVWGSGYLGVSGVVVCDLGVGPWVCVGMWVCGVRSGGRTPGSEWVCVCVVCILGTFWGSETWECVSVCLFSIGRRTVSGFVCLCVCVCVCIWRILWGVENCE